MNQNKELKRIARQAFPPSQHSFFERRICRKNLYNEMSVYWQNHPESSSEDIRDLFCGNDTEETSTDAGISKKPAACFIILVLLIMVCVTLFFISGSWDAPVITMN